MIEYLKGKKTYIVAGLAGVVFALQVLGIVDTDIANQIYVALGITGFVTLRSAIK